jgi:hypothetical protein
MKWCTPLLNDNSPIVVEEELQSKNLVKPAQESSESALTGLSWWW